MRAVMWSAIAVWLLCAGCANNNQKPAAQAETPFEPQDQYQPPPSYVGDPGASGAYGTAAGDPGYSGAPAGGMQNTGAAPNDEVLSPSGGRTYVVQKGDTLSSISRKFYGDSKRWKDIYNANKQLTNPNKVPVGARLAIP